MRVCDVVLNSIWFDPRVRKQIVEYTAKGIEVVAVGLKCSRYNPDKVSEIPCKNTIVEINEKYDGQQKGLLRKIIREGLKIKGVEQTILSYHPDIIHANDLNALIPAYRASRRLKCKIVYDSHEINTENYTDGRPTLLSRFMKAVERYLVKHVDLMVCVSNAAAEYFSKEYNIAPPLVVTNCALAKEMVSTIPYKHEGFEVLNHGQFYPGRGYEEMIEAASLLKDYGGIKLCVRGFGRMEPSMRKTVEDNELNNFVFYPPVNVEELIPQASYSHIGIAITKPICLNFKLSVSNKLFEYAAAGLPVIMSDIPEHRLLNEKYNFGLIMKENTGESLADCIKKVYDDQKLYKQLSENAIAMSRKINWENEFNKLIEAEYHLNIM